MKRIWRLIKLLFHYLKREKSKLRQNLVVFIIFLFISSAIWLVNALRKNYISVIAFPVHYVNYPKDKAPASPLPSHFYFTVKASGFTLLRYKIYRDDVPVVFDINSYVVNEIKDGVGSKYYINTKYAEANLENQLPSELRLIRISPSVLLIHFDQAFIKKVPVIPAVKLDFQKQYSYKDLPVIWPDSIHVSGPKSIIDTMQCVKTETLHFKNLKNSFERILFIKPLHNIRLSTHTVTLKVSVEKYTEAVINVPIVVKNVPDSLLLKTIPDFVNVKCFVGLSSFYKMKPFYFKAVVDYRQTADKFGRKLKVNIDEYPRMISNITYSPQKVDYLIKKKK